MTRKLKDWIKGCKNDLRFNRPATVLSRFYQKQDIKMDFNNARIIDPMRNYYELAIHKSI